LDLPRVEGPFYATLEMSDYSHHSTPDSEYYRQEREGFFDYLLAEADFTSLANRTLNSTSSSNVSECHVCSRFVLNVIHSVDSALDVSR
jgi:hypothetical protein